MPYGLPSRQVSLHHVLPDSLEFPVRMFGRRWQAVRLSVALLLATTANVLGLIEARCADLASADLASKVWP